MRRFLCLAIGLVATLSWAGPVQATPDGTLSLASTTVAVGDPIAVSYSTPRPDGQNWIGLYSDPGNGPVNEKYVGPSTKWVYAPDGSGTASVSTTGLAPGDYIAYFLHDDGYTWLAQPQRLKLADASPMRWASSSFFLRNGQVASAYSATVKGLVRRDTAGLSFRKTSGPGWASVSSTGTVGGTPTASGTATIGIEAANSAGQKATASVGVRVQAAGAPLVPELKVLSYDLWHGGTPVSG
ncbi:hypothetical protein SMC26_10280 [Actinomadura fulvescens]|uniref:BIG2 domain-containing protein n=1 Tax=Actinomadura fulvescens TaxID=46160 RepID=A0ABP6CE80_9ACTN